MSPYERALDALARAEAEYARLKTPQALARVLSSRRSADRAYLEHLGIDLAPTPRPTIGNRR